jgi:hypothetical protein
VVLKNVFETQVRTWQRLDRLRNQQDTMSKTSMAPRAPQCLFNGLESSPKNDVPACVALLVDLSGRAGVSDSRADSATVPGRLPVAVTS